MSLPLCPVGNFTQFAQTCVSENAPPPFGLDPHSALDVSICCNICNDLSDCYAFTYFLDECTYYNGSNFQMSSPIGCFETLYRKPEPPSSPIPPSPPPLLPPSSPPTSPPLPPSLPPPSPFPPPPSSSESLDQETVFRIVLYTFLFLSVLAIASSISFLAGRGETRTSLSNANPARAFPHGTTVHTKS